MFVYVTASYPGVVHPCALEKRHKCVTIMFKILRHFFVCNILLPGPDFNHFCSYYFLNGHGNVLCSWHNIAWCVLCNKRISVSWVADLRASERNWHVFAVQMRTETQLKGMKRGEILERVCHEQRSGNFSWALTSRHRVALCGVGGGSSQSSVTVRQQLWR